MRCEREGCTQTTVGDSDGTEQDHCADRWYYSVDTLTPYAPMPRRAKQYRPHATTAHHASTEGRGSRHERGYTARWSRVAKLYLKQHPLCVLCKEKGRVEAATCVDHIDGLGPLGPRGFDEDNFRSLCTRCHNARSARDRHAKNKG